MRSHYRSYAFRMFGGTRSFCTRDLVRKVCGGFEFRGALLAYGGPHLQRGGRRLSAA